MCHQSKVVDFAQETSSIAKDLPQPPWLGAPSPTNYFTCSEYNYSSFSSCSSTSFASSSSSSASQDDNYDIPRTPEESVAFRVKGVAEGLPQPPWLGATYPSSWLTGGEYDNYSSSSSSACSSVSSGPPRSRPPPLYRRQGSQRVRVPITARSKFTSRSGKESTAPVIFRDVQLLTPGGTVVHILQAMQGWKHFGFFTLDMKTLYDDELDDYRLDEDDLNLKHSPTLYRKEFDIRCGVDQANEVRFREALYEIYGSNADEEAEDTDDEEYMEYVIKLIRRKACIPPPILTTPRTMSQLVHDLDDYNDFESNGDLENSSDSDVSDDDVALVRISQSHLFSLQRAFSL